MVPEERLFREGFPGKPASASRGGSSLPQLKATHSTLDGVVFSLRRSRRAAESKAEDQSKVQGSYVVGVKLGIDLSRRGLWFVRLVARKPVPQAGKVRERSLKLLAVTSLRVKLSLFWRLCKAQGK